MTQRLASMGFLLAAVLAPLSVRAAEPGPGALELRGEGVQIYACAATPEGAAWKLKAPEAVLKDADGRLVGHHFAGPTWRGEDGGLVVGAALSASPAPERSAIPWLVVRAAEHQGGGLFAGVAYITRTRTVGGKAPASGCDGAHLGAEVRVPYSAVYTFFSPAP